MTIVGVEEISARECVGLEVPVWRGSMWPRRLSAVDLLRDCVVKLVFFEVWHYGVTPVSVKLLRSKGGGERLGGKRGKVQTGEGEEEGGGRRRGKRGSRRRGAKGATRSEAKEAANYVAFGDCPL